MEMLGYFSVVSVRDILGTDTMEEGRNYLHSSLGCVKKF
jgi:hypothetical protein